MRTFYKLAHYVVVVIVVVVVVIVVLVLVLMGVSIELCFHAVSRRLSLAVCFCFEPLF